MTRQPNDLFYYIFEISDLSYQDDVKICQDAVKTSQEKNTRPPNFPIEFNLTGCGRSSMDVYLGGGTFINVEVIK